MLGIAVALSGLLGDRCPYIAALTKQLLTLVLTKLSETDKAKSQFCVK